MSLAGERVDHYRIVGVIGAGSMGHVYRAIDERLMREVAIKLLPQSDATVAERQARFLREAKTAGNLNHPGIVTIHDIGRWRERTYIVMELVEGWRLSDVAAARPLSIPAALSLCRQAAEALAAAHERGILHRDIKPDNLMVTADGRVKILDFGVAKLFVNHPTPVPGPMTAPERDVWNVLTQPGWPEAQRADDQGGTPEMTRVGALLGTPSYMSPEQASGRGYEARSDIYSLAIVLYELVTQVRPLVRGTLEGTLVAAIAGGVPPASSVAPQREIPRSLDQVLSRALAVRPEDRWPDMRSFAAALRGVEEELIAARRGRLLPIGVAVVGIAALAAGGVAIVRVGAAREKEEPPPAIEIAKVRRLTFDSGCEELPSMWPDGKAVLFDGVVDGDTELFRLELDSGERQRLTYSPGWDLAGAVSPDARWIAYIHYGDRGRELMVIPWGGRAPAGPPRALGISRGYPTWTRRGELIYSNDRGQLFAVAPDGKSPERQIASLGGGLIVTQAHDVAGGFLYGSRSTISEAPMRVGLIRPDGSLRELGGLEAIDSVGVAIDAARDGFYFARLTATGYQLQWRNLEGDRVEDLAGLPFPHGGVTVSPARDRMVLSTCRQVWHVGRLRPGDEFEPFETRPDWNDQDLQSLGGPRYALVSDRSGTSQIWIIEEGRQPRLLVAEPSGHLAVSPDRQRLAWTGLPGGQVGIHVVDLATGARTRVTEGPTDDLPRFSRDGTSIYFLRGAADGVRIHLAPAAGGAARAVSEADVVGFDVSPVDDRLLWLARGAQGRTIMLAAPGGAPQAVPGVAVSEYTSPRFAPDGKRAWVVRGGSELVEVVLDGSAPARVVWRSRNEAIGNLSVDPAGEGWIGELALYEGDLHLAEGRFR
ncbi:MAG TPA: protein kinase [Kofleriaceae bacterium]|nr:protein kinase [Kofleriaceae bacterium]